MMPDQTKPFQIEVDASLYATGGILTQLDSNGERHPCAFILKTLSDTQRNYDAHDRELLAIIRALEEWQHFIFIFIFFIVNLGPRSDAPCRLYILEYIDYQ